jgi:hypothetical protein
VSDDQRPRRHKCADRARDRAEQKDAGEQGRERAIWSSGKRGDDQPEQAAPESQVEKRVRDAGEAPDARRIDPGDPHLPRREFERFKFGSRHFTIVRFA